MKKVITFFVVFAAADISAQVFVKVTGSPIASDSNNSYYCAWGDYDNDNDLDFYVPVWFGTSNNPNGCNALYENDCSGSFSRISAVPGGLVSDSAAGFGGYWIDFNNDSYLDLHVWSEYVNSSLYKNNGDGTFVKLSNAVTQAGPGSCASWCDYNNDGKLDVFTCRSAAANHNGLYKNNGSGGFSLISNGDLFNNSEDNASAAAWADYNNDGFMDLYIANAYTATLKNNLYKNNGNGNFTEVVSGPPVDDAFASYGCAWADYDNDLDLDLYVSNSYGPDYLYRNNGDETFTNVATSSVWTSLPPSVGAQGGASFADYDNDGDLDLFLPNFGQNYLLQNNGSGVFSLVTNEVVSNDVIVESYGGAWCDYDEDGDLDLVVPTAFGDPNDLFYNNIVYQNAGNSNSWIKFQCVGSTSNKNGIGVRVYVKANINGTSTWQMREVNANTTRGGESGGSGGHIVHFGLGSANLIDTLKVVWPASGITNIYTQVAANRFLEINENLNVLKHKLPCHPGPRNNARTINTMRSCTNSNSYDFNLSEDFEANAQYSWNFGNDAVPANSNQRHPASISFTSPGPKLISLTITRGVHTETIFDSIIIEDVHCANGKTLICHNGQPMCVNTNALQMHLGHGDCIGSCSGTELRVSNNSSEKTHETSFTLAPNPLDEFGHLNVRSSADSLVEINLYNHMGRKIRTLYKGEVSKDMQQSIYFGAKELENGIYFIILKTSSESQTIKAIVEH